MRSPNPAIADAGVIGALRSATQSRHEQLGASRSMRRLFDSAYTLAEYRAHLGRLLGIFEPLEGAVAVVADAADPALSLRRSVALREDLERMGASASEIAGFERCRTLPPISRAGVRGYAYVTIGSMLGGKIIGKRLRSVLGPAASLCFYDDGNGRPEALWSAFCRDLEEWGAGDVDPICATAAGIFDAYAAWLSEPIAAGSERS